MICSWFVSAAFVCFCNSVLVCVAVMLSDQIFLICICHLSSMDVLIMSDGMVLFCVVK